MLQTILQLSFLLSPITAIFECDYNFLPFSYEVTFNPDLNTTEVGGKLSASIFVQKPSNTLILDKIPEMTITDLRVGQDRRKFGFKSIDENYENGFKYRVVLNDTLVENKFFSFNLKFWYRSDETRDGLYIGEMSKGWKEYDDHRTRFAASYLTLSGCQTAFPCINCPLDHVNFKIHISSPCYGNDCNYTTVSSTTISQITHIAWADVASYSETPKLHYRNLALFVGPFQPIRIEEQIIYSRIWDEKDQTAITFGKTAQKYVNFFEKFFDVKLLQQLKHVVIPDKLYPENVAAYYGAIFYKEPYMAGDYDLKREEKRRKISGAVSRQFFNNLRHDIFELGQFTDETFGKYFEYLEILTAPQWKINSSNQYEWIPSRWKISDTFTVDVLQKAMETYKDEASILYKPSKVDVMLFKSATFLRYMEHILTTPVFVETLKDIVKKDVVLTDIGVLKILEPYVKKLPLAYFPYHDLVYFLLKTPGYPVLTVSHEHMYGKSSIVLTKQWYTQFPHQPSNILFHIPVSFSVIGENFEATQPNILLYNKTTTIPCKKISCKLAIFNTQQTGFYRVNYDPLTWIHIIQNLKSNHTSIHVLNRAQLVDDAFALADGQLLSYQIPLKLSLYLRTETAVGPWIAFFRGIRSVELWFKYCERQIATILFENYVHDLIFSAFGKSFAQVLAPSEEQIRLMSLALPYLCKYNSVVCQSIAHNVFLSKNLVKPDISLLDSVYCWALKFEHPMADWLELRAKYKKSVLTGDEVAMKVYRKAVACGKKNNEVMWFLNYAVSQGFKGNKQEATDIFLEVIESAENGYRLTLRYLTMNIRYVYQSIYLSRVLLKLAEVTYLPSQVNEFSHLIKQAVSYTKIEPLMRQLQRNGNWSMKHHDHMTTFLECEHLQHRLKRLMTAKQTVISTMKHKWDQHELIIVFLSVSVVTFALINSIYKVGMRAIRISLKFVREEYGKRADRMDQARNKALMFVREKYRRLTNATENVKESTEEVEAVGIQEGDEVEQEIEDAQQART